MKDEIIITLGNAIAKAKLLSSEAPRTCDTILKNLPITGKTGHSIDSGWVVNMELDPELEFTPENQTIYQLPGDIVLCYMPTIPPPIGPSKQMISFVYDRKSNIRSLTGPIPVNLFAQITEGMENLAKEATRMRSEGFSNIIIKKS